VVILAPTFPYLKRLADEIYLRTVLLFFLTINATSVTSVFSTEILHDLQRRLRTRFKAEFFLHPIGMYIFRFFDSPLTVYRKCYTLRKKQLSAIK